MANKYGEAALIAARLDVPEHVSAAERWDTAVRLLYPEKPYMQKKGAPKSVFLGLCGAGLVKGVPTAEGTPNQSQRALRSEGGRASPRRDAPHSYGPVDGNHIGRRARPRGADGCRTCTMEEPSDRYDLISPAACSASNLGRSSARVYIVNVPSFAFGQSSTGRSRYSSTPLLSGSRR